MKECKRDQIFASEKNQRKAEPDMTRKLSNVRSSVQTGKSVKSSSKPFPVKGTVRTNSFDFLREPRTIKELVKFVKRLGGNPQNLLRFFRGLQLEGFEWAEENGKVQWKEK